MLSKRPVGSQAADLVLDSQSFQSEVQTTYIEGISTLGQSYNLFSLPPLTVAL